MADLSGDDDAGIQNACEDVNKVQVVDESEQAEFFEALLHHYFDPSMFLIKGREALKKAATKYLYEESKGYIDEFTTLRAVLQFFMLKSRYGWSDASFNKFWRVRTKLFPKGNKVSANTSYATTGVEKIDACRNDCILYRCDDYKDLESCPNCGVSRYKTNKDYREEENRACVKTGKKRKKTKKKTE
jgi:hypothetical protein